MSHQPIDTAAPARAPVAPPSPASEEICIQPAGFLLELSPDWLVLRASENIDDFLGVSHVTMIDEPLGRFLMAQPLHDLRNLFSRLRATTGITRAYGIRLTEQRRRFDIAFQLSEGRVLVEGLDARDRGMGESLGTVGGLIDGLRDAHGAALLDAGARRMRALSGFDRVTVQCSAGSAQNSRGTFAASTQAGDLPPIVADVGAVEVPIFPRRPNDKALARALLRAPASSVAVQLRSDGIASCLTVPLGADGHFLCENRTACGANLELHAAAELFAQMFAMRLEIDSLRRR
jgi:light-regulated signal transduction histidine kinase (bacteriophytochrome)